MGQESEEIWTLRRMKTLGFYYGTALRVERGQDGVGEHVFLDMLARQLWLLRDLRLAFYGEPRDDLHPLELSKALALAEGDMALADQIGVVHDQLELNPGLSAARLGRSLREPMRALGARLLARRLSDQHPLLGGPFHRLLIYCDTRLLARISAETFDHGFVRELRVMTLVSHTQLQKLYFAEAIIAMSWANDDLDARERRLIRSIMDVAGFDVEARRLLQQCIDGDLPSVSELAEGITDPINRRFLLEQIIFTSFVDGEQSPQETAYIQSLAQAFGIDPTHMAILEAETAAAISNDGSLLSSFSTTGAFDRIRRQTQGRVERIVRANLGALRTEIQETGDLMALLMKSARHELTPDEQARVKSQLLDICKTIPALAIFVAPGGSLLLPLLMKVLPFNLMPSAFSEDDEVF